MEAAKIPAHYASADEPSLRDQTWLGQQWDIARLKAAENRAGALRVLDKIQKVPEWSGDKAPVITSGIFQKTFLPTILRFVSHTGITFFAGGPEINGFPGGNLRNEQPSPFLNS
jgi:hypothetical protein